MAVIKKCLLFITSNSIFLSVWISVMMYCEIISPDKYRETASCLWIAAFSVNIVLNCYVILRTAMSDYDSIVLWISFSVIFDLLIFVGISFGTTSEKSKFRFIIMFFYILVSISIMCFLERKKRK